MTTSRPPLGWWLLLVFGINLRLNTVSATPNTDSSGLDSATFLGTFPDSIKRVAVGFHGQYMRKEKLIHAHAEGCSVYFNHAQNISNALVSPLLGSGIDVVTMFDTVHHCPENDQMLVDTLGPVSWSFSDCMLPRIVDSYLRVIDLVLAHDLKIDALIMSRFDVRYRVSIDQMKIDWGKVNLAFPDAPIYWAKEKKVSDLFHVVPAKYLQALRKALNFPTRRSSTAGHWIYKPLVQMVGGSRIHFIEKMGRTSNVDQIGPGLPFLFIDRSCKGYKGYYESTSVNRTTGARCPDSSLGRARNDQRHVKKRKPGGGKGRRRKTRAKVK